MPEQSIGSPVPDVRLPLVGGGSASLGDALQAKAGATVVFWSGVCSHCQRYDGYLNALPRRHPELALLAVASRQDEDREQLEATVRQRGLEFPILHDADRAVAHRWLVQQTPRVFLVDARQRLLYRGAIDNFKYPRDPAHEPYLERAISEMLAGAPVSRAETPSFGCPIESVYYSIGGPGGVRP